MIVFDLECRAGGHRFEGWFGSSEDFVRQLERGLVNCPECGGEDVIKAPMAPNLARKGNQRGEGTAAAPQQASESVTASPAQVMAAPPAIPPEARAMMVALAKMQAEALKTSRWVGGNFAEDARAMHYGEREAEVIHGQASAEEAQELIEEGIAIAPVLFPIAPPEELN